MGKSTCLTFGGERGLDQNDIRKCLPLIVYKMPIKIQPFFC